MAHLNIKLLHPSVNGYYQKSKQYDSDSGVDLYFPENVTVPAKSLGFMVGLGVSSEMFINVESSCTDHDRTTFFNVKKYCGYWLLPRSSIAKTPLRLSNSIGLVDADYRGELKVALDNHSDQDFVIEKGTRLIQLAHPQLLGLWVNIVDELSKTKRGEGGFGSTGK